jgi:quercetin dioxygenase-like cupin family protein
MKCGLPAFPLVIPSAARNLLLCSAILALPALATAQAANQKPAQLPGEPHHHLKIDNEYVRAFYVEVPPHESTQLHQHDLDYFYVVLGPADIMNIPEGKPGIHQAIPDAAIHFAKGGFAHTAQNLSDKPFRNLTISFVHPQTNIRNRCEKVVDGPLSDCPAPPDIASAAGPSSLPVTTPLFESDEVLGELVTLASGARHFERKPKNSALLMVMEGAHLRVNVAGEPSANLRSGGLFWLPAGLRWSFAASGKTPSRYILLYFKDSAPASRAGGK